MRKGWRNAAVVVGAAIAMVASTITPANAAIGYGTNIFNYKAAGKCIGISNGLAGLWNCTSNADQKWKWGACIGQSCQLKNGNGKCLAVNGGSYSEGARIIAYTCNGALDQYWLVIEDGVHQNFLFNEKTSKVVAVKGGSTANGAALVQWTPLQGALDQLWY
jgi:Ricin-type beta-trefoil lectin domain